MSVKQMIEFIEVKQPITEPVTKFGGHPVWIDKPQWPISKQSGKPMQFICQIKIDPALPALFGECLAQMAYLFMTDDSDDPGMYDTWDPNGGENAVILQPGVASITTQPLTEGPTLYRTVNKGLFKKKRVDLACEYAVDLKPFLEPDFISEDEQAELDDAVCEDYFMKIQGNKLGGAPCFVQNDELPFPDGWKLLLQIDSDQAPFWINFGDGGIGHVFMNKGGIGHVFMNKDGTEAKFGWQCY